MKKLKPKALQKGDTIAIISPAGNVENPEKFDIAKKYFESKGFSVKIFPNAKKQGEYLAGSDEQRISDLENAFADKTVKAIITSRGGYGSTRIIDKINYEIIKQTPKIFCGYSDITALHCAIYKKTGLTTFHSPFAISDFGQDKLDKFTEENFWNVITQNTAKLNNAFNYTCINGGNVIGEIVGGNLCVLTSILGSGFEPDFGNKILFLEEVNEPLYKIDRMLTQLRLNGIFDKIKGLLVGKFSSDEKDFDEKVIKLLKNYDIPCGYGFSVSHEIKKTTMPLNVKCKVNFTYGNINIKENYLA